MKKKIIISSILTIALCLSMIAGSTFALFTSESKVDVTISSAKVDIDVEASDLVYASTLGETLGSAQLTDGNVITLKNLVPGDYVTFTLTVTNNSTVAVNYRALINVVADDGLYEALDITYNGEFVSAWNKLESAGKVSEVEVTVSLPEEISDAKYMGKTCTLQYFVEAIQGNVVDICENVKEEGEATTLNGDDLSVLIPANATAGSYSLLVSNKQVTTDANGQSTLSLDLKLKKDGVNVSATEGIQYKVSFMVGKGLNIAGVTHNGAAVTDFTYSGLTGEVQFYTSSFSPFTVTYSQIEGLDPNAEYLAGATDIHNSTTMSGTFQMTSDVKTSDFGDDSRYGYGYEFIIRKQADYTLDLNGKTLIHDTVNENANKNAFTYTLVANHAGTKLTINGDGKVVSHNSEGYTCAIQGKDGTLITINGGEFDVTNGIAVWAGAGAHIIINGGSFVNSDANTDHELIYSSGGVIDIYGGFFHNTDGNYTLNIEDRNRATGFINVYGGTFVNFDPSTGSQDPNNIKVAEGYTVISETQANGDVWYIVVPV